MFSFMIKVNYWMHMNIIGPEMEQETSKEKAKYS